MGLFSKIKLLFTHGDELEEMVNAVRREAILNERDLLKDNLHLCLAHKQEVNHSIYGEHNCDYCKLLKKSG